MKSMDKRWKIHHPNWEIQSFLAKELSISPIMAQILANRNIRTKEEAHKFLYGSLDQLTCPWELAGMNYVIKRIKKALDKKEKILIYGDYDVDGMTATALLVMFLKKLEGNVGYYIPERSEGYGLNKPALDWIKQQGYQLIITVDCGISAIEEIEYGSELGLDFIITDHHEPGPQIPKIKEIINPKLKGDEQPADELAGVGVAFKLLQGLAIEFGIDQEQVLEYLDLVALGTIADVVPLVGENRLLVKYGLPLLSNSTRPGIQALIEIAGMKDRELNANQIAFTLAPRLNAAGRMDSPLLGLELLLTHSAQRARELAVRLQELNRARQLLEQQIMKEALEMLEKLPGDDEIIVLASPLWHPGVLGIVASRLVEKFYRPTILLAVEGEEGKGSGRSIPGFDLFQGLIHCQDLLVKAGGHCQAVGLTLEIGKLEEFRDKINEYGMEHLQGEAIQPVLEIEGEVISEQLDFQLMEELSLLSPFGHGNPEPVLALRHSRLQDYRGVGKDGRHLKFQLASPNKLDGIGFNLAELLEKEIDFQGPVNLAFRLQPNEWNGRVSLQLILEDLQEYRPPKSRQVWNPENHSSHLPREGEKVYYCTGAQEQFQKILHLIRGTLEVDKPVCLLFPSQRLMAIYEKLLDDILIKDGINCQRLQNGQVKPQYKAPTVFLGVSQFHLPEPELYTVIRLLFPDSDKDEGEANKEFNLVFKEVIVNEYDFIRQSVAQDKKLSHLAEIVGDVDYPLFVYASHRVEMMKLVHGLQKIFPEKSQRIWYYHRSLCPKQKEMVKHAAVHGLVDVIIAGEFLELLLPWQNRKYGRVIVDAPYSVDELFLKCQPNSHEMVIHGLWHPDELARNRMILETIFPEGKALEALIDSLLEMGASREGELNVLAATLRKQYPNIQLPAVQHGLDIVKELTDLGKTGDYKQTKAFQLANREKQSLTRLEELEAMDREKLIKFFLQGSGN